MEEGRAGEAHTQQCFHDVADGAVIWQTDVFSRLRKSAAGGHDRYTSLFHGGQCVAEMIVVQNFKSVLQTL